MRSQSSNVPEAECSGVAERPATGPHHRGPPFPCARLRDLRGQCPRWAEARGWWFGSGAHVPCGPLSLDQSHVQPPTDATPARPQEWNRSARRPSQTAGHCSGLRSFHLIYIAGEKRGGTDSHKLLRLIAKRRSSNPGRVHSQAVFLTRSPNERVLYCLRNSLRLHHDRKNACGPLV